jgi:hypothetical protein
VRAFIATIVGECLFFPMGMLCAHYASYLKFYHVFFLTGAAGGILYKCIVWVERRARETEEGR